MRRILYGRRSSQYLPTDSEARFSFSSFSFWRHPLTGGDYGRRWPRRRPKWLCCGSRASCCFIYGRAAEESLPWRILSGLQINVKEFEPKRLFMLSVYLLVMGLLLGYLARQQKRLRGEKAAVARILSKVRVEAGLTGTLQQICREILYMCGAERLLIASQEIHSHRTFLGELRGREWDACRVRVAGCQPTGRENLSGGVSGGSVLRGERRQTRWSVIALDGEGMPVPSPSSEALARLKQRQSFRSLIAISFIFGGEWRGRVLVFNPAWRMEIQEKLRFRA